MLRGSKKTATSASEAIKILWEEGFFKNWANLGRVSTYLGKRGNNFSPVAMGMALLRASYLTRQKKGRAFEYIQRRPTISKETESIEAQLFDGSFLKQLGKAFSREIEDLQLNFGRSGNCSAFLLRKMLEKLIYIVFAKNGFESGLEDKSRHGGLVGLDTMINLASTEKVGGIPFITPKTAHAIKGIKFLGDVSAHNPLVDVDMKTIVPQMPFIITAYKELMRHL